MDEHVSLAEAAKLLGLSVRTLYNKLSRGQGRELRAFKLYGKWRVPETAVEQIIRDAQELYRRREELRRVDRALAAGTPLPRVLGRGIRTMSRVYGPLTRLVADGIRERE